MSLETVTLDQIQTFIKLICEEEKGTLHLAANGSIDFAKIDIQPTLDGIPHIHMDSHGMQGNGINFAITEEGISEAAINFMGIIDFLRKPLLNQTKPFKTNNPIRLVITI